MNNIRTLKSLVEDCQKIEIPIFQRDYAQGRTLGKAPGIREGFLDALYTSLHDNKILHLDFIYGQTKEEKFIPLDGQQRLTTLYLLYWYLANHDEELQGANFLKCFTYKTRITSREFCQFLTNLSFDCKSSPSKYILNHQEFYSFWRQDPTIQSMLTMLDAIHEKFKGSQNLYDRLDNLQFSFLPDDLKLSDDIYIKMNSRGKELTPFENFKARFEQSLENCEMKERNRFADNMDSTWTDLFWEYKEEYKIDNPFLRFFLFMTEMLYFEYFSENERKNPFGELSIKILEGYGEKSVEFYKILQKVYFNTEKKEISKDARKFLFDTLDMLVEKTKLGINNFFGTLFYNGKDSSKVKTHISLYVDKINLFEWVSQDTSVGQNFKLLLFFILKAKLEENQKNNYRIVRNLIINDPYNMRAEDLSNQIHFMEEILDKGILKANFSKSSFLENHIAEEKFKEQTRSNNEAYCSLFDEMENCVYFKGSIRAIFNIILNSPIDQYKEPTEIAKKDCLQKLLKAFETVKELAGDDINDIWGELIIDTSIYKEAWNDRIIHEYNKHYEISAYLPLFCEYYVRSSQRKKEYLDDRHCKFIKANIPLEETECAIKQLYIHYLVSRDIKNQSYWDFFENGCWQFGIYGKTYYSYAESDINKSSFRKKLLFQLYNINWVGGQSLLKLPTKQELDQLEKLYE